MRVRLPTCVARTWPIISGQQFSVVVLEERRNRLSAGASELSTGFYHEAAGGGLVSGFWGVEHFRSMLELPSILDSSFFFKYSHASTTLQCCQKAENYDDQFNKRKVNGYNNKKEEKHRHGVAKMSNLRSHCGIRSTRLYRWACGWQPCLFSKRRKQIKLRRHARKIWPQWNNNHSETLKTRMRRSCCSINIVENAAL